VTPSATVAPLIPCDIARSLGSWGADPDRVGVVRPADVADEDVVLASGQVHAGLTPQGNIVVAIVDGVQSELADGRVVAAVAI
jgi:hypothetical protein